MTIPGGKQSQQILRGVITLAWLGLIRGRDRRTLIISEKAVPFQNDPGDGQSRPSQPFPWSPAGDQVTQAYLSKTSCHRINC